MYNAYITKVKNIRPAENSDNLNLCTVFGTTVVVGKDINETDLYIYFPSDGQLSVEYCAANDLVRRKDENGNPAGGYLDPNKRNVTAIRLRGNRSDGLIMPLSSLAFTGIDISTLKEGDNFTLINGVEICRKYIPRSNKRTSNPSEGNRTRKKKNSISFPYFKEHIDTPQLRYNLSMFQPGDVICLTEKVHGTSSRNGYALKKNKQNWLQKIFNINNNKFALIGGTRRTILSEDNAGYYGTNEFRYYWNKKFEKKLQKGEEVFGEIAGFYDINSPIMPTGNNKKSNDKEFIKHFGDSTTFSYGCCPKGESAPLNRYFIYRMTYTSPDGYEIEYPWDLVKLRAEQMGFETVPELERFIYTSEEDFLKRIEKWLDKPSTIDSSHIIEGVVVRVLSSPGFKVAKEKSWNFKVIEGIIKLENDQPDMEEAQESTEE